MSDQTSQPPSAGKISTLSTTINFAKLIFGFATFTIVIPVYDGGWLASILFFALGSILMIRSTLVLGECEDKYRKKESVPESKKFTLTSLCGAILGDTGKILLQGLLFSTILFIVSAYSKSIGEMLASNDALVFFKSGSGKAEDSKKLSENIFRVIAGALAFALTFFNTPSLVSIANKFALGVVGVSLFIIPFAGFRIVQSSDFQDPGSIPTFNTDISKILGLITNSFFLLSLHLLAVDYRQEIKNPKSNFAKSVIVSTLASAAANLIFLILCSYLFRSTIDYSIKHDDNDPKNYGKIIVNHIPNDQKWTKIIISIALSVNLLFSVMNLSIVPCSIVEDIFSGAFKNMDSDKLEKIRIALRFVFILKAVGITYLGLPLGAILDLLGAVCFPLLSLIFPAVLIFMVNEGPRTKIEVAEIASYFVLGIGFIFNGLYTIIKGFASKK